MAKLSKEQIVTVRVLEAQRESATATAHRLGVKEGAVRYHRLRAAWSAREVAQQLGRAGLGEWVVSRPTDRRCLVIGRAPERV